MKFAMGIFTALVIIIGSVLFVQYQVYSDQRDAGGTEFNYTQEIEVVYRNNSLDIRHHFKNLPEQKIEISIPDKAVSVDCFLNTESSCERLSEDKLSFKVGETRSQSISYVIPLDGELNASALLKDVFAELKVGSAKYSTVHISTDSDVSGQWITGLPLIGEQQLSMVNFSMFSGEGQVKDLYWDSRDLTTQNVTDLLSIYTPQGIPANVTDAITKLKLLDDEPISIVQGNSKENGYRIIFMPEITENAVQQHIVVSQVDSYYHLSENFPHWLKELVASFTTGTVIGGDKTKEIYKVLADLMTDEQMKKWENELIALNGQELSPAILDNTLSKVLKSSTNYLTKNSSLDTVYPFYYVDNRDVSFDGEVNKGIEIIYYEGRVLYNAQPILDALGYESYEGENGYYVSNDTRIFRFPKQAGFYVFNQRRYNTASEPIVKLQNEYFIEESWMQRLFLVDLNKTESTIDIQSMKTE